MIPIQRIDDLEAAMREKTADFDGLPLRPEGQLLIDLLRDVVIHLNADAQSATLFAALVLERPRLEEELHDLAADIQHGGVPELKRIGEISAILTILDRVKETNG